jgi:hypothetical protein
MIDGSNVHIYKMNEETALDVLPPKIYTVRFHQLMGYYLEITKDRLEMPVKIYGTVEARVSKCVKTYMERSTSTGILLTGDKGTGKSLLMSMLANAVIDALNMPIILIKDAFTGTQFTSFIETIGECCLIFDEFGKMYTASNHDHDEGKVSQASLLSLMDGVDKTKRLIIMTENREWDINEFILNRPSRVYYHFRYHKLDEKSITDYCEDFGVDSTVTKDIIDLSRRSRIFSFDMLQSIIEEHLRFNISIDEITQDLNVDVREKSGTKLEILKVIDNVTKEERRVANSPFIIKPSRYDYAYVKLESKSESKPTNRKSSSGAMVGAGTSSNENGDEFHIKEENLAFESKGKEIYETEKYTVITKVVMALNSDYSLLL